MDAISRRRPTMRAMTRRQFLGLAGVSAAGAAAACAFPMSARPAPTGAAGKVQLVYQDWRTEWFPAMAQRMLEQFHATHPNIQVFYTLDPENLEEKMARDFRAGTAPDVFAGCCSFFPIWGQEGHCLNLRPYVQADLDRLTLEDWDRAQYRSYFTRDGRQYALPKYHGALALYYNKDLFDEYGVDYPDASWDHTDYAEAMQRLTADRDGDGQTDLWGGMIDISWERLQVHINAWGGHLVDPDDPTRSLMGEPPALEAMEWIRARMWDDRVMPTPLEVQNHSISEAFVAGQVAMVEDGSWSLRDILAGARFRIGVVPLPAGPARRATLATTDGFAIYAGTKHPEAAWELLKFLISEEYGRAMAQAHFLQPARASLVDDWIGFIREQYPEEAGEMDLAAFAEGHRQGYSVIAEVFANQAEAQELIYAAWDRIYSLGQAPVDLMKTVSQQVEAAQQGFQGLLSCPSCAT